MHKNHGYTLIELLIGLVLSGLVAIAVYKVTYTSNLRGTRTVREMRSTQEVNKVMDRISSEIENAISLNNATATILASEVSPSSPSSCRGTTIGFPGGGTKEIVPHGLIPLPGMTFHDLDQTTQMTYTDPHEVISGNEDSDALRILYIPLDSRPIRIKFLSPQLTYVMVDPIEGETLEHLFPNGGYFIISDRTHRELYRVTGTFVGTNWNIHFSSVSYWNAAHKMTETYDGSAFIQRVNISTYAHNPETQELFRDDHQLDDGVNPTKGVFSYTGSGRHSDWKVVAKNIGKFQIHYEVATSEKDSTLLTIHNPIASLMQSGCPNQMGYPLFRSVSIEITVVDQGSGENLQINTYSRRATSKNLVRPAGLLDTGMEGDPIIISTIPPPPPSGGPVGPTPLPGMSF